MKYHDVNRVVIDESVASAECARAMQWLSRRSVNDPTVVDIKTCYSGLADERILASLLGPTTVLVTNDRVLHNTVLARGYRSLHIESKVVNEGRLPGVRPKQTPTPRKAEELEEGTCFHPPSVALREHLTPISEREAKTLRTRRRRIRNHFGGFQNLTELAITVSWLQLSDGILLGIRLRITANNGMKALDASESYVLEKCAAKDASSAALCYALVVPIQLMLSSLKTTVFFDATGPAEVNPSFGAAFEQLRECFPKLAFQPTTKGILIERLRRKLQDLRSGGSNEVRPSPLSCYLRRPYFRERFLSSSQ